MASQGFQVSVVEKAGVQPKKGLAPVEYHEQLDELYQRFEGVRLSILAQCGTYSLIEGPMGLEGLQRDMPRFTRLLHLRLYLNVGFYQDFLEDWRAFTAGVDDFHSFLRQPDLQLYASEAYEFKCIAEEHENLWLKINEADCTMVN